MASDIGGLVLGFVLAVTLGMVMFDPLVAATNDVSGGSLLTTVVGFVPVMFAVLLLFVVGQGISKKT